MRHHSTHVKAIGRLFAGALALAVGFAALECGAMTGFDPDYDAAASRAKERGRPLFVLFTGSDWCIWCQLLEKEVFSQPEFLDVATNAYELAVLDFPQDASRQTDAERRRNRTLMAMFGVEGFPTVLLLDANGRELHRASYEPGGAKAWMEAFQEATRQPETSNVQEDPWLRDWAENVRTNMVLETCASFRETRLRPFLLAQMDPDSQAPEEERRILNAAIDHVWGTGSFRSFKDRERLVEILDRTAKKPFAALVAAIVKEEDLVSPVVAWLEAGGFSGEDMRAVFWTLWENVGFGNEQLMEAVGKAQVDEWLKLPWRIVTERRKAWDARGNGWAKDVTDEGRDGWKTHGDACRKAFARAWELHPYPEAAYLFVRLAPFDDEVFLRATAAQLDYSGLFGNFLWYNCYPRWCGSHEKMKQFAERCRATGRHDTMVPYHYARSLLRMVKDMNVRLEDYFRDHGDELDGILEVTLPQIASTNAFANVRKSAGIFATLAYYLKGDYAKAAETWRSFSHGKLPDGIWDTIDGYSDWHTLFDGISGKNGGEFQRLNALYLSGDYAGFLKDIGELREKGVEFDKGERLFAEERSLLARMKTDFPEGKTIVAAFPKDFVTWRNFGGIWRMDGTVAFRDGGFNYGKSLEWIAPIPPDFRMEFEIAPSGERDAWQFDFFVKPTKPMLSSWGDWPHLSLKFADGKCNVAFGSWYDVYKNGSPKRATVDYTGGTMRLAVEYKGGRASIFLGDAPVIETDVFADQLRQVVEGHAKFNGSGVRLLSLAVMRPR